MRGGVVVVRGDAGARAADRLRRGMIIVEGSAGAHAGSRMIAGMTTKFENRIPPNQKVPTRMCSHCTPNSVQSISPSHPRTAGPVVVVAKRRANPWSS